MILKKDLYSTGENTFEVTTEMRKDMNSSLKDELIYSSSQIEGYAKELTFIMCLICARCYARWCLSITYFVF